MLAEEEKPRKTADQHREELRVQTWMQDVVDIWAPLAACIALLQERRELDVPLYKNVEYYTTGNKMLPDKKRIRAEVDSVRRSQTAVSLDEFNNLFAKMDTRMGRTHLERLRWLSGKGVWIPLVVRLFRQHTGEKLN